MLKRKNWLSWVTMLVLGMFIAMSCGGGCDAPIVDDTSEEEPPPPGPEPDPLPEGNWTDTGNYDTTWYLDGRYEITNAKELAGLAKLVNDGTDTFEDKIIHIMKDIDLGAHYWVPIGFYHPARFSGTFNGHGSEICNMIVEMEQSSDNFLYSGLFGYNNGTINNVHLSNVQQPTHYPVLPCTRVDS